MRITQRLGSGPHPDENDLNTGDPVQSSLLLASYIDTKIAGTILSPLSRPPGTRNSFFCTLSTALFHLSFHQWLESFTKESNEVGLFWSSVSIKLDEDGLEMFEVRSAVLDLFHLVLRISFNLTPDSIHESPGINKILSKESLKLDPMQEVHSLAVVSRLC